MNKTLRIILVGFFLFTFIGQVVLFIFLSENNSDFNQGMSIRGANVVFFMADGYSESDFLSVKHLLDQWRGTVIVAGLSENQTTTEGSIITDLLISEIGEITTYDAIVIPGGELTQALNADQNVGRLLNDANDQGLVI
ncbi:MAG: DJ-1/PfpI family protein, partial [Candidatus Hodarchaeales archaeon]